MKYNIRYGSKISASLVFIFLTLSLPICAQELPVSKYGVAYINSLAVYEQTLAKDSQNAMVDLQQLIPNLVVELRYATLNNFMRQRMYPAATHRTYLRKPAAMALLAAQMELNKKGLGFKIFDAYRPYSVTVKFWEMVHDDRYVADPSKASGHNRGIAVDLTIVNLQTGKELAMPTGFDNFTDSAHHDFMNLTAEVLANRKMLADLLTRNGFIPFATEWWHYSLPNPEQFSVLDLGFEELGKASRSR